MEAPVEIPPIIDAPRRSLTPPVFMGLVALAIAAAVVSSRLSFAFPKCSFLAITGLPCAFCGGTRALRAVGHFHWGEALWWNPLVTLGVIAAAIGFVLWIFLPAHKLDYRIMAFKRLPLLAIGLGAVFLNWIFLMCFLPR